MDFSKEIRKLYHNLKQFEGLRDIQIDADKNHISYFFRDRQSSELYSDMCCKIKKTLKCNHPDLSVLCIPPENCKNQRKNLKRNIRINVNERITNPDERKEILLHAMTDFNRILQGLIKYGYED